MYNENDRAAVEKYSSAVTLSDMEVFIFPQLMYSLMLANIMSPQIWKWRDDPWFAKSAKGSEMNRMQRLKQYIMDHFAFNLDLDTWGLTTKERELSRFSDFINEDVLARSNALFGYEGDKYYFDIDIRRHFGLDKYTSNVIPYWKTETLEAMEAFRFKDGYAGGAGECVSFAALYASAAFVAANIPLEKIFMLATPLHSQNFIDVGTGVVTNNRRIVTKNMWYNGTELSAKARRALENETVTIIAHNTGFAHTLYNDATIDKNHYLNLSAKLTEFLCAKITYEILANFLRHNSSLQKHFQISHTRHGKLLYIDAEKVYSYEHASKLRVGDKTQPNLLLEIDTDDFYTEPRPNRFDLGKLEMFFKNNSIDVDDADGLESLQAQLTDGMINGAYIINELVRFCKIAPRMPCAENKNWTTQPAINLDGVKNAQDAYDCLQKQRETNEVADLAFTAFRDLSASAWKPFLKAAVERNPVCVDGAKSQSISDVYKLLTSSEFANESIYDSKTRLAQPDEVWNFKRGDGLEKAIALAAIYINNNGDDVNDVNSVIDNVSIDVENKKVKLVCDKEEFVFKSDKKLSPPKNTDWVI